MIYLDNGATTFPKPLSVKQNVNKSLQKYSANPGRSGHHLSLEAAKVIYECRKAIKELFNVFFNYILVVLMFYYILL